jgi:hypothetical protein
VSDGLKMSKQWPKEVRSVGNRIRRVAPLLRSAGLRVHLDIRSGKARSRLMLFEVPEEAGNRETGSNDVRQCPPADLLV